MAKKKLDKDMINDVSGGIIREMADGRFEVVGEDGENIFRNNRTFRNVNTAIAVARAAGESDNVITYEEVPGAITGRRRMSLPRLSPDKLNW